MSQVEETSYLYAAFRNTFRNRQQFRDVKYILANSDGTHFEYLDAVGERRFGVISDLSSFSITRAGVASMTIPLNTASASLSVTISPALNDTVLANWLLYGLQENPLAIVNVVTISAKLASTSSLTLRATHLLNTATAVGPGAIDVADLYPTDIQVDVGLGHQHLLGALTNPTHTHVMSFAGAAVTFNVFWMIVHK